jgi:hypothetical protein
MNKKLIKNGQILIALVITTVVFGISSCEKYSYTPPVIELTDTIYFQTEIQPIFTANCKSCHGAIQAPDLRPGNSYKSLTENGYVDLPAATSKLYTMMIRADHAPRSTDLDKQKVLIWITQGAMDNKK